MLVYLCPFSESLLSVRPSVQRFSMCNPSDKSFLPKVKVIGQGHNAKKCFVNAITWKIIIAYLQFTVKLLKSMEMT